MLAGALAGAARVPAPRRRMRTAAFRSFAMPKSSNCCATISAPMLRAAGLAKQNVKVVIINDRGFNAFVMDGRHIFINAGALFEAKTPNEVIGVLAHETGASRRRPSVAAARAARGGANAVDHRACSPASASRSPARAAPGGGTGMGGILGAAGGDPALAARPMCARRKTRPTMPRVKFLNATGQSPKGMYDTFKRMSSETAVRRARCRPLCADPSDAGRSRRRARDARQGEPLLGQDRLRRSCSCVTI